MRFPSRPTLWLVVCASSILAVRAGAAELAAVDESALRERIQAMREGLRDVPLPLIIEALAGHRVVPWDGAGREALEAVADDVLAAINRAGGIKTRRINEAGNATEAFVLAALRGRGFSADRPSGPSGRARAAGYPDLEAERDGLACYVEVKCLQAATAGSTQRTFYLSPSGDFKVTRDACHLLIAIELVAEADGRFRAHAARWLDLSRLKCDLKYEFNASNRDLYRPEAGLVVIERTTAPEVESPREH